MTPLTHPDRDLQDFFAPARGHRLTVAEKERIYSDMVRRIPALRGEEYRGSLLWRMLTGIFPNLAPFVAVAVIFVLTGAGVTFAEQSLPGDFLYPIKQMREEIKVQWTFSSEQRAEAEAHRMGRRVEEATALEAKGKLTEQATVVIDQEYRRERREALKHIQDLEVTGKSEAALQIRARMNATEDRYERLFKGKRRRQGDEESSSSAILHRYPTIREDVHVDAGAGVSVQGGVDDKDEDDKGDAKTADEEENKIIRKAVQSVRGLVD